MVDEWFLDALNTVISRRTTSILLHGPSNTGKRDFARALFATGSNNTPRLAITSSSVSDLMATIPDNCDNVHVIVCGEREEGDDARGIMNISNPADLTGVEMGFSRWARYIGTPSVSPRILVEDLSVFRMYRDMKTVLRFMKSMVSHVREIGGIGLFVHDDISGDYGSTSSLLGCADVAIEFRLNNGETECSLQGHPNIKEEWVEPPSMEAVLTYTQP